MTVASFLLALLGAVLVVTFPGLWIGKHLHVLLGVALLIFILGLLAREFLETENVRATIVKRTAEQIAADGQGIVPGGPAPAA